MVFGELGQRERGGDAYYAKKRRIQWYGIVQVDGQAAVVSTRDRKQASYATTQLKELYNTSSNQFRRIQT